MKNELVLRLNGIVQAKIVDGATLLIYNTQTTLKEVNLEEFTKHLTSLRDRIKEKEILEEDNGENEIYDEMIDFVYDNNDISCTEVFKMAKNDLDEIRSHTHTVQGYSEMRDLLNQIPYKYERLIGVDKKDDLYFSYQRIGKISNIAEVRAERLDENLLYYRYEVDIERKHGEPVRIIFKHGKDENGKQDYLDYEIIVGY